MELQTAYAFGKQFDAPFGEVEQKVRQELVKEGFGVMDPVAALGVIGNAELTEIAAQVRARMERFLAAL